MSWLSGLDHIINSLLSNPTPKVKLAVMPFWETEAASSNCEWLMLPMNEEFHVMVVSCTG